VPWCRDDTTALLFVSVEDEVGGDDQGCMARRIIAWQL